MIGTTIPPLRVLRTTVTFGIPFGNAEILRRALARWGSLANDTRKPNHSIAAPFLDMGEIVDGIGYVAQLGQLTLEVTKDDDTLVATMLALAAETLRSDSSGEIGIRSVGRDFEVSLSKPGPLRDVLGKFSMLSLDEFGPIVRHVDLQYVFEDTTMIMRLSERNDLRPPHDSSPLFWISTIVTAPLDLDATGMASFLQAWPYYRTLMHHAIESILGTDHA